MHTRHSSTRRRALRGAACLPVAWLLAAPSAWATGGPPPSTSVNDGAPIVTPASDVAGAGPTTATPASAAIDVVPTRRHRLSWDPEWPQFGIGEYIATSVASVAAIAVFELARPSDTPKFTGPILFDTAVRDAFRLRTRGGITGAADASNVVEYVIPAQSLIDSLLLPTIDRSLDVTWQLGLMDAEAYAFSGLVTASLYDTTGRARPSYADCKAGTSPSPFCNIAPYASFPSGHTTVSMTGAGLICAHHEALPLYGDRTWDVLACVEGITFSAGVGMLRVMADRHYASDVLTGGAVGFFSGYALPKLLHYWKHPPGQIVDRRDVKLAIVLGGGATPFGGQAVGVF